jgi:hypothetical protein
MTTTKKAQTTGIGADSITLTNASWVADVGLMCAAKEGP